MMPEQGRTLQMSATVLPLGAYILDQSVTWASSNTDVATVNEAGLVTSVNCGVTTITVTTNDGEFTATSTVTVLTQAEADIKLNEALNAEGGNLVFRNDTVYPWELCTDGDRFCAHSTNNRIDNSESSVTLDLGSVIGGSTLNWDWKASSEEYDGLVIYLNDTQIMGVYANAETPWTNVTYTIPQSLSSCVIRWSFFKNNIDFAGKDMSWLDNVSFVAGESAPVTGITLRPKTKILLTGKSLRMKYNTLPMNADNPNVSWS